MLTVAVFTLVRWLAHPVLQEGGFMFYFVAVVVVSWLGGLGPSLLAVIITLLISTWFFQPPPGAEPDPAPQVFAGLALYFFVSVATALLSGSMRAARRRAEAHAAEARRQREQMQTTLQCIGDAVIVTDRLGRVTMMNPIAESLTGWTSSEAAGQPLSEVFQIRNEQTGAPVENPVERVLREGTIVGLGNHTVLVSKHGVERPIDDSAAPVWNAQGGIFGAVLIFRDVSERRHAEQALRDADRRKDEFLAVLAHELRNPLAPVRMALDILRLPGADAANQAWAHDVMERQIEHLVRLVDDLLDVSRIMRGKIEMRKEASDMRTIVTRAVELAQPLIDGKSHQLHVDASPEPIVAHVDPVRLVQVVGNLLTNAAKFTEPNGQIWISSERQDAEAVIRVRDTGVGISAEVLPRVFELFIQGSANGAQGGLGIGLTLAKSLVELNGGRVEVASDGPGKGAEFVVRLPLLPEAVERPPTGNSSPLVGAVRGRRVLVVDDNVDAADALSTMLRLAGHDVRCCYGGLSALEVVEDRLPEVVFLDLGMPDLDGLEVARRLRQLRQGDQLMIVAVTGWGQEADRRRTAEAGFDHHLVKPVGASDLHRLLTLDANAAHP
ncbi:MAG TPA: ATP-binding protein [Pirellulales bacterium]|nr:ATP-binding protein [Pirellulales bacterium]